MCTALVTCQSSLPIRSVSWKGAGKLPGLKLSNGAATTTPAEACCRVCSPSIKKNSLSFRMAPPTLPPYWLRWKVAAVAEKTETFPVKIVRAGLRGYVDRAGRGEVVRKIQAGLSELKFGDRAGRNARGSGADVFIADVHSIHRDSRAAAESASERNRRKPSLGGIEVAAILDLDARLELCEIEEVASIHRQIFNLLSGQASRHLGLIRIDGHSLAAYFHNCAGSAELELDRRAGNLIDLHNVGSRHRLEARCLYANSVVPWNE